MELIKELGKATSASSGTSLITYYLPGNQQLWIARDHVNQELATAKNIKNKLVNKDVQSALRIVQSYMKVLTELPKNGIVICAGLTQSSL